eukprot:5335363-Lingulodinium_polyedra.AAC.1
MTTMRLHLADYSNDTSHRSRTTFEPAPSLRTARRGGHAKTRPPKPTQPSSPSSKASPKHRPALKTGLSPR